MLFIKTFSFYWIFNNFQKDYRKYIPYCIFLLSSYFRYSVICLILLVTRLLWRWHHRGWAAYASRSLQSIHQWLSVYGLHHLHWHLSLGVLAGALCIHQFHCCKRSTARLCHCLGSWHGLTMLSSSVGSEQQRTALHSSLKSCASTANHPTRVVVHHELLPVVVDLCSRF